MRRRLVAVLSIFALAAPAASCGSTPEPASAPPATTRLVSTEWSLDFSDSPAAAFGTLDEADVLDLLGAHESAFVTGESELSVEAGQYLTVRYAPTAEGSDRVQWAIPVGPTDDLWLSYRFRVAPNWEARRGGKLPGLASYPPTSGGANDSLHWSARMMWRPVDDDRSDPSPEGYLSLYAYHADNAGTGDFADLPLSAQIQPGTWHRIVQHIWMNTTPSSHDGGAEVWFDGAKLLERSDYRWSSEPATHAVGCLFFSTFYGGNSPDYAPRSTTFVDFDDFVVTAVPIDTSGS
jgi:hypothetical protein